MAGSSKSGCTRGWSVKLRENGEKQAARELSRGAWATARGRKHSGGQ